MRAFATRIGQLRPFSIIDGADTVRILKAFGKLGFGDKEQASAAVDAGTGDIADSAVLPSGKSQPSDAYAVSLSSPSSLTKEEIGECMTAIKLGGAVSFASATLELPRAPILAVVRYGTLIVGVGAIKRERVEYARKIAQDSGVSFPPETRELGYVSVLPDHRGHNLSGRIVNALLTHHKGRLFATTSSDRMKSTLGTAGFVREGKEWPSKKGELLSFWKREPAES
jgi:hypothetical protein